MFLLVSSWDWQVFGVARRSASRVPSCCLLPLSLTGSNYIGAELGLSWRPPKTWQPERETDKSGEEERRCLRKYKTSRKLENGRAEREKERAAYHEKGYTAVISDRPLLFFHLHRLFPSCTYTDLLLSLRWCQVFSHLPPLTICHTALIYQQSKQAFFPLQLDGTAIFQLALNELQFLTAFVFHRSAKRLKPLSDEVKDVHQGYRTML